MFLFVSTVLSKRVSIYLFAFLVIQALVLITTFEFIRKPWEGVELEEEKIIQEQAQNLFDTISSFEPHEFINDTESHLRGVQFKAPVRE